MRSITAKLLGLLLTFTFLFGGINSAVAAPNATLGISADPTTAAVGSTIKVPVTVTISEFSADTITVVVKYDTSKLDFNSTNEEGSSFPTVLGGTTNENGVITIKRGRQGDQVSGNVKVTTVQFTAKATGSTSIGYDSSSRILDYGEVRPLNTSATVGLNIVTTTSAPISSSTSGPNVATPAPTKKPAAPKATPKPTATTNPSSTSNAPISAEQSIVTASTTNAIADGLDLVTITAIIKRNDGSIATDLVPTLSGLRGADDTATDFTLDSTTQSWVTHITSKLPGTISATVNAGGVALATKEITFTQAGTATNPSPDVSTSDSNGGFGRIIVFGVGVVLLLLVILFFLWKRLHSQNNDLYDDGSYDNGPAYPGDGTPPGEPGAQDQTEPTYVIPPVQQSAQDIIDTSPGIASLPAAEESPIDNGPVYQEAAPVEAQPTQMQQVAAPDPGYAQSMQSMNEPPAPQAPVDAVAGFDPNAVLQRGVEQQVQDPNALPQADTAGDDTIPL
jgi:hypothetical protein